MKLGEKIDIRIFIVLSGFFVFDIVLGIGGYLCGWIIEVYGFESLGKIIVVFYVIVEV